MIDGKIRYVNADDVRGMFPERPADCHKGNFGYAALIGGSLEYSGAIRLAAMANSAVRSGAGVVTVAAPRSICPIIAGQILEATVFPLGDNDGRLVFREKEFEALCAKYDCIAFGMGIGNTAETVKAVRYLLTHYDRTLIVDADGLNAMSTLDHELIRGSRARLVLTPHFGEFARLSGMTVAEAKADPVSAARYLARELDAVVLLKGSTTVVAGPPSGAEPGVPEVHPADNGELPESSAVSQNGTGELCGRVLLNDRGCPGMAGGGSGDVLSGILAAVCVNAEDLVLAAASGAYINGAAGELAQSRRSAVTMTSADTAACVAEVIESVLDHTEITGMV